MAVIYPYNLVVLPHGSALMENRTEFVRPVGAFVFMASRKRYFVQLDNQQIFRIPAARWHQWIAAGLLILATGSRSVAVPACPGVVWLENGELHQKQDPITPFIGLNCRVIERHAVYNVSGPRWTPEQLQKAIQREYGRD